MLLPLLLLLLALVVMVVVIAYYIGHSVGLTEGMEIFSERTEERLNELHDVSPRYGYSRGEVDLENARYKDFEPCLMMGFEAAPRWDDYEVVWDAVQGGADATRYVLVTRYGPWPVEWRTALDKAFGREHAPLEPEFEWVKEPELR